MIDENIYYKLALFFIFKTIFLLFHFYLKSLSFSITDFKCSNIQDCNLENVRNNKNKVHRSPVNVVLRKYLTVKGYID